MTIHPVLVDSSDMYNMDTLIFSLFSLGEVRREGRGQTAFIKIRLKLKTTLKNKKQRGARAY